MTTEPSTQSPADRYAIKARIAPAALTAAPALALGVAALPLLPGAQKLWTLLAVGLTTFAALVARRAGNAVQPSLWASWGGKPTTRRLRYRDNPSASEVTRRHLEVERVLGGDLKLPTQEQEAVDEAAADAEYDVAMRRVVSRVRNHPEHRLLNVENRNFGYARNLLGLKRLGLWCAGGTLVISLVSAIVVSRVHSWSTSTPLALPLLVAVLALFMWRQVDQAFVKPSAEAYADRVVDAVDDLPTAAPRQA